MSKRQKIVAGNWKMNASTQFATQLANDIVGSHKNKDAQTTVILCPPAPYLSAVQQEIKNSAIKLGAQNVSEHESGAFTGEVAASMLTDLGAQYVIIGHSERRLLYGEQNSQIAKKISTAQQAGLNVILCLGETLLQRQDNQVETTITAQLDAVFNTLGASAFDNIIIAYEPIWAIGTGQTASPAQAQAVHQLIRQWLKKIDTIVAAKTSIIYGGSVNTANASQLFSQDDIDGGLIGGASLDATTFNQICFSF